MESSCNLVIQIKCFNSSAADKKSYTRCLVRTAVKNTVMLTLRPKHCAHFGASQCEKNEQQMTKKIPEGTGAHDTGERCIHLDLLSLEKRIMRGNLTLVCNYVIEVEGKREPDSSWLHVVGEQEAVDTTQGTGHSNEIQGCYLFSKSGTDYPERPWNFQP